MPCRYFGSASGCRFGDICHYSHSEPNSVPMCKNSQTAAGCYYGDKCSYRHKQFKKDDVCPTATTTMTMKKGKDVQNGKGVSKGVDGDASIALCRFFANGGCMHGVSCRYRHVENVENGKDAETETKEREQTQDEKEANEDKKEEETEAREVGVGGKEKEEEKAVEVVADEELAGLTKDMEKLKVDEESDDDEEEDMLDIE